MNGSSDHIRDAGSRSSRSPAPPPITSTSTSTSKRAVRPPPARPTAAAPAVRTFFDPWNSSSTGHQRAENRLSGSTSWRYSRNLKLSEQYKGGLQGGSKRVFDTVGAGSKDFGKDGRKENGGWEKGASGLRTGGQQSLAEIWGASKPSKDNSEQKEIDSMQSRMSPPASAPTPRDDAFLDNDGMYHIQALTNLSQLCYASID